MILLGDLEYRLSRINQYNLSTAKLHDKTFTPFKNKFAGKEIAIIACGPSLKEYKPLTDTINIGLNRAFLDERLHLDFMFFQDAKAWSRDEIMALNNYQKGVCQKFYGISWESIDNNYSAHIIPESDAINADALRYKTNKANWIKGLAQCFPLDISTQPLADFSSVVFSAIQFALWTNPKRIYLVGCDCSDAGHFYDTGTASVIEDEVFTGYMALRKFAHTYYPDTEIISINPVGLKGLFKDVYQTQDAK